MFLSIVKVVIVPIVLGFVINHFFGKYTSKASEALPLISVAAIALIVASVVSHNAQKILETGAVVFAVVVLHNVLGYLAGFLLGILLKLPLSKRKALSVEIVDLLYYEYYHRDLMIAEYEDYIIANTHMSRTSEYGLPEVDVITNALAKYEGKGKPILFMGDLNTRPGFKVYNKLAPLMQCISPIRMADGEGTYCSEKNADGEYTGNWILDFIYLDNVSARSGEWSWTSHFVKDHVTSD